MSSSAQALALTLVRPTTSLGQSEGLQERGEDNGAAYQVEDPTTTSQ